MTLLADFVTAAPLPASNSDLSARDTFVAAGVVLWISTVNDARKTADYPVEKVLFAPTADEVASSGALAGILSDSDVLRRPKAIRAGPFVMDARDLFVAQATALWVNTVNETRSRTSLISVFNNLFRPTAADIGLSALLGRILSGRAPLPSPPPRAYSYPWYDLVELDGPHWAYEMWEQDNIAFICQTAYRVLERDVAGVPTIVQNGPYRFRLWLAESPYPAAPNKPRIVGWWMRRIAGEML